ncbi:MAG: hypothetical protein V3W51_07075 [Candidatus Brocadiales bacterium]
MRPVKTIGIIVVTCLFFLLPSVSLAELPELPSVPTGLSERAEIELDRSRSALEKTRIQLNKEIKRFDAQCVNRVRDGDLLVKECTEWELDLQTRVDNFMDLYNEFRRTVKGAEAAEAGRASKPVTSKEKILPGPLPNKPRFKEVPSPKVPIVGVITSLKGTVERKTSKGWVPVDKSSKFSPGTELRAGPDGYAEIYMRGKRLQDGSYLSDGTIVLTPGKSIIFADPNKKEPKLDKLRREREYFLKHGIPMPSPGPKPAAPKG